MSSRLSGQVAAVTGAGSGIGKAVALALARRGVRLAVADWDESGLAKTADMLPADTLVMRLDVSKREQFAKFATACAEHFGHVHQLYNIAGLGGGASNILDEEYEVFERTLRVNLWGVIYGSKEFLPLLIASGDGHLINISSLNGIMGQPGIGAYCTSKFAVRGFTETLRAELLMVDAPVGVTVVHPGGVRTAIRDPKPVELGGKPGALEAEALLTEAERRRNEIYKQKLFKMSAEEAAEKIISGVERRKGRVLLGQAKMVDRLVRLIPEHYPRVVANWSKKTFHT